MPSYDYSFGEVVLTIEYDYTPGVPEQPPTYSHGGLPADGPRVEITNVTLRELDANTLWDCLDAEIQEEICSEILAREEIP